MIIEWKIIEGYPMYYVSNTGLVESRNVRYRKIKSRILKPSVNKKHGYEIVSVSHNNKRCSLYVHRLVAQAFIPNTENKRSINHKNAIRTDNRVENLEWVTPSENMLHAIKNNLFSNPIGIKSSRHIINDRIAGNIFKSSEKYRLLSKMYGISIGCVADIKNGRTWNHVTMLPLNRKIKSLNL